MAVGLTAPSELRPISGVRLGTAAAGIRYADRDDLLLIEIDAGASCAAVFTRNAFCAAPVDVARAHLRKASPRYLLVNSGNANAGTGRRGREDALACCEALAAAGGCDVAEVLPFSTGVIGERLEVGKLMSALPSAMAALDADRWERAARAIMTTDTLPKGVSREVVAGDGSYRITGVVKGSGMIRPDMATMLCFVATDACVPADHLQQALDEAVGRSFNRITVDGDTSTNDACVLIATGIAKNAALAAGTDTAVSEFKTALQSVLIELAQCCIRDAEGATKFITLQVEEGGSEAECLEVAFTIAHSPLVKTAFFASDPNWGRILACVGRSGLETLDCERVRIYLDDVCIVEGGARASGYSESDGERVMAREAITVRIALGRGDQRASVWTSDLSQDYVRINAEYRS